MLKSGPVFRELVSAFWERSEAVGRKVGQITMVVETSRIARKCERAVITAYQELRGAGIDDMRAFQSCTSLYRIHHPEASVSEARRLVSEWIDHHIIRQDTGPTPGCNC